ncbi:MAG: phage portal protein, partial [Actinomycetes bacterium]
AFAFRGADACDYLGYPLSLKLLRADEMDWRPDLGIYEYRPQGGPIVHLEPSDVLHMAIGAEAGRKMGQGIIARYQAELKLIRATEQAQFVVMNAGVPTGIISIDSPNVTEPQAQAAKKSFLESQKTRGVAVLAKASFSPVTWNPTDMAMIPAREFNLRLASDITGTPPYMLGVPAESRVYSNQETEWTNFVRGTMGELVEPIEWGLSTCLPRGQEARLDLESLQRADSKTRWELYNIALTMGAMTVDEIRDRENLGPLPPAAPAPKPKPNPPAPKEIPA